MSSTSRPVLVLVICACTVSHPTAFELKTATLAAFDRYVGLTETRMAGEAAGSSPFLWIDRQPPGDRTALHARLGRGDVVSARLETRDGNRPIEISGGMVHHWVGTVLLPGVPLGRAVTFVQGYARYPEVFAPIIQRARVLSRSGDRFTVMMRTRAKNVIEVVLDADYRIDYQRLDQNRLLTRSVATNLFLIDSPGGADERRTPVDQTTGWIWRLNTYCAFEQRIEGTYQQCESVSLTRGIPWGWGPLVNRFVIGFPRETLEFTLGRVREEAGR
jgi:hypothetical protein